MSVSKRIRRPNTVHIYTEGDEYPALQSVDFDAVIADFITFCKAKNLSVNSVTYYGNSLKELKRLLAEAGVNQPNEITEDAFKAIIIAKLESGAKDTYVQSMMRGWRVFFRYIYDQGFVKVNAAENVPLIKSSRRMLQTLTKPQIKQLLAVPDLTTFIGYRNYTILNVFLETGVRVSELEDIRLSNVLWDERSIRVFGKGRKERYVPFQSTVMKILKKYANIRGPLSHDYLFVNIDNTPLKKRTIQEFVSDYGDIAKIRGVRVSCHTLRHSFAKLFILNGGDPYSLREIMGHVSLEQALTYVSMFGTDVMKQHRKFSPIDRLDDV